ncbi:MAG: tRNA threonylcarbamoyladenosine dehydratase, partial [Muribaculaceae bacterium]|nr:tRNA threonylcarbamoyladenosine dehydratase [Muribaculaceae bacterium]
SQYDYVVDCIDTVSAKMELVRRCARLGVPIICSMGAANKLDATAFRVADISETDVDPLARIMRKKLRKEGIEHFKCVFSKEQPREPLITSEPQDGSRPTPASNAWVPAAAGLILGGEVVLDLIKTTDSHEF